MYCDSDLIVVYNQLQIHHIYFFSTMQICEEGYLIHDLLFLPISTIESGVS